MVTAHRNQHSWQLVDATLDETNGGDVVESALARRQATLWYGPHCFELTSVTEASGDRLLRLQEVGRRVATGSGPAVMGFLEHGYHAEQRVALCPGTGDESELSEVDAGVLRALGQALLDDTARAMDLEGDLA